MAKGQPSKLKYIGAWLLFGLVVRVSILILDLILTDAMVEDLHDLDFYFFVSGILTLPIFVGAFILIYRLFSSLNIRKVMPYLYVFAALGTLITMAQVTAEVKDFGIDLRIYYGVTVLSLIASLYLIRSYFIKKPERWF